MVARDAASPRSSSATVQLIITDADDGVPEFRQTDYSFGTFENEPPGVSVGRVRAVDSDSAPYNRLTYHLQARDADAEAFAVDAASGVVTTTATLDRERQAVYYLAVVAVSESEAARRTRTSVSVFVADRNDNAPRFVVPGEANATVTVATDTGVGGVVLTLAARDADTGDNARLRYSIVGGNAAGTFALDAVSGELSANVDLAPAVDADGAAVEFALTVRVRDGGSPPLAAEVDVLLVVRDASSLAAWVWLVPTDVLIIVLAILLATLFVAVIFTIMIVVTLQRRRRRNKQRADDGALLASGSGPTGCDAASSDRKLPVETHGTPGEQSTDVKVSGHVGTGQ